MNSEKESDEVITVSCNPVLDAGVFNPSKNFLHLLVFSDVFAVEVAQTTCLEQVDECGLRSLEVRIGTLPEVRSTITSLD